MVYVMVTGVVPLFVIVPLMVVAGPPFSSPVTSGYNVASGASHV